MNNERATFQVSGLSGQQLRLGTSTTTQLPSGLRPSQLSDTRKGLGTVTYSSISKPWMASPTGNAANKTISLNRPTYYQAPRASHTTRPSLSSTPIQPTFQTSNSARKFTTAIPISVGSTTSSNRPTIAERLSNTFKQTTVQTAAPIVKVAASPVSDKLLVATTLTNTAVLGDVHSIYSPKMISSPSGARNIEVTYDENSERRPASIHRLTVEQIAAKPSEPVIITSRSGSAQLGPGGVSEPPTSIRANNLSGHKMPNREISAAGADHIRGPLESATSFGRYLHGAGLGLEHAGSMTARPTTGTRGIYNRDTFLLDSARLTDGNNSFRATLNSLQPQPWTQRETQDTFIREVRGGSALPPHINLSAPRPAAASAPWTDRERFPTRNTNPSPELDEHARQTGLTDQIRRELRRLNLEPHIGSLIRKVNSTATQGNPATSSQQEDTILRDLVRDLEEKVSLKRERYFELLEVNLL